MKRIFLKICVAALVLFALLVISFTVWRVNLAHDVKAKLQAIRAAGLPASGEEADAYYTAVPDNENAAVKMAEAFGLMTNYPDGRSNTVASIRFSDRRSSPTSEQLELLASYCAMNSNALAQAGEAVKLPHSRYPIHLSWGAYTLLPHLAKLKNLSLIAEYESLLDEKYSAADISTITGMARTLDTEPVLISKLVRIAMLNMAEMALERRLNAGNLTDAEMKHLGELFAESAKTNQIANGLIGERATFMQNFGMSYAEWKRLSNSGLDNSSSQDGPPLPGSQPLIFKFTGLFEREQRFYLQTMQTFISFAENCPKNFSQITNFQEQIWRPIGHNHYIILSMLMPAVGMASEKEIKGLAQVRTAQTALAVERFRLATGRLPENLKGLTPEFLSTVPVDPFDGAQLRYHRLAKGYVIYSVGADGHDDGGREKPADWKPSDKTTYDITFTVER
ncbi:MAG: hypothetical protein ABSD57_05575 [Verrucomicrobiota bacterium]|jgi:hypothetical protein